MLFNLTDKTSNMLISKMDVCWIFVFVFVFCLFVVGVFWGRGICYFVFFVF